MKLHLTLIPLIGAALAKGCAKSGAEMSSIAATKVASRAGIYAARDYYPEDDQASIDENMLSAYSMNNSYSENHLNILDYTQENEETLEETSKTNFQAKSKETAQELMTREGNFLECCNLILDNTIALFENQTISYEEAQSIWKEKTSNLNKLLYEVSALKDHEKFISQVIKQLEIIQNKQFKQAIKKAEIELNQRKNPIEESKSYIQETFVESKSDSLFNPN